MALPVLALPVSGAIGIDPGVTYYYVIAQTGGTSFSVDPVTDFSLSFGASGVLSIRYTGTDPGAPAQPPSANITIHVTNADGTVSQTFTVHVIRYPERLYANITSPALTEGGLGAPVTYQITIDLPNPGFENGGFTFGAYELPPGFVCDAQTGRITGTTPAVNGTYAITLYAIKWIKMANVVGPGFYQKFYTLRYWILVVGAGAGFSGSSGGGTGAGGDFSPGSGPTSFTFSGTFNTPSLIAGPIYERPFQSDPKPYIYHVQYRVTLAAFIPLAWDVPGPYGGIHVGESQWKNERGGILTFWRTFALVPPARDEWESHIYAYQWWHTEGGSASIAEIPKTVNSRVHYDYFKTTTPETAITLPRMPRVINLFGVLYAQNGYGQLVAGQEILAEDATYHRWHGNIYERKQRFVIEESAGAQLSS